MKYQKFFKDYNKSIYELLSKFDVSQIDQSVELILECKKNNGKVYVVGNGGSSSIASHVSVDFAKVANVSSDTFNNANLITCFANDYGHDNWVKEAIRTYTNKNDMLIQISSSGTSKNIVNAAQYCKVNSDAPAADAPAADAPAADAPAADAEKPPAPEAPSP